MSAAREAGRTPLTLVTGLDRTALVTLANALVAPGTVVVGVDLRAVDTGHVVRSMHRTDSSGAQSLSIVDVELEHGCLSCTLRLDLLPTLRRLHRDPAVDRIMLVLDPAIEPEPFAVELGHTIVEDDDLPPAPAGTEVVVQQTICTVEAGHWLTAATGDETLREAGLVTAEDERTLAQVAIAQVRFADLLLVTGADRCGGGWELARLHAVLVRLAPAAGMRTLNSLQPITAELVSAASAGIAGDAPRGRPRRTFDPLLAGCPDLDPDCGVVLHLFEADRPFHPERLHAALDVLLEGVVSARGRLWLADEPESVLWLESAGGGLGISRGGRWLAADSEAPADAARHALAALVWDPVHGDRHTSVTVLCHRADPDEIDEALSAALVTDAEIARGSDYLESLPSPFGDGHQDPCDDLGPVEAAGESINERGEQS